MEDEDKLLLPAEVAALFRVNSKTVTRWAKAGKMGSIRTLGGHHRFSRDEVTKVLRANYTQAVLHKRLEELDKIVAERQEP
jgi:excisionase family DNA binding protein